MADWRWLRPWQWRYSQRRPTLSTHAGTLTENSSTNIVFFLKDNQHCRFQIVTQQNKLEQHDFEEWKRHLRWIYVTLCKWTNGLMFDLKLFHLIVCMWHMRVFMDYETVTVIMATMTKGWKVRWIGKRQLSFHLPKNLFTTVHPKPKPTPNSD